MSKSAHITAWVVSGLLAAAFFMAGGAKLAGAAPLVENFERFGLPLWFLYVTGAIEVVGAALLLVPRLAPFAALVLGGTMVGGIGAHVSAGDPLSQSVPAVVLGLLTMVVIWLRRAPLLASLGRGADSAAQTS